MADRSHLTQGSGQSQGAHRPGQSSPGGHDGRSHDKSEPSRDKHGPFTEGGRSGQARSGASHEPRDEKGQFTAGGRSGQGKSGSSGQSGSPGRTSEEDEEK